MGQASVFQIGLIILFTALVAGAVLVFALGGLAKNNGPDPSVNVFKTVTIWGTYPQSPFSQNMTALRQANGSMPNISYRQIDERYYDSSIAEALATGGGPDLFMVNETIIRQHLQKITSVSFTTFPERQFKDTYSEGSEIFLFPSAIYAIPFGIDPIVMYWNRDLITAGGFSTPPKYWDEMYDYVKAITVRSKDGLDITRATVALGDFENIDHATEIISTLLLQAGIQIAYLRPNDAIATDFAGATTKIEPPLRYYTEFTNPTSPAYTWNRALPSSRDAFLGNKLAIYFGYASEYRYLREANPNLNFDVALMPQPRDNVRPITYGKMVGFAISRMSQNKQGALYVARTLSDPRQNELMTDAFGLASVRRDLLGTVQSDPWKSVAYQSALYAKAWYQPTTYYADFVFETLINSIISGKEVITRAISTAGQDLAAYLR